MCYQRPPIGLVMLYPMNIQRAARGTRVDERADAEALQVMAMDGAKPVSAKAGVKLAKDFGAVGCVECSVLTRVGVDAVFKKAVHHALKRGTVARPPLPTRVAISCDATVTGGYMTRRAYWCWRCDHLGVVTKQSPIQELNWLLRYFVNLCDAHPAQLSLGVMTDVRLLIVLRYSNI